MMDKLERAWYRMGPIGRAVVFGAGVAAMTTLAFGAGALVAAVKVKQQQDCFTDDVQGDTELPELPEIQGIPEE